jgi:hypothetical protein
MKGFFYLLKKSFRVTISKGLTTIYVIFQSGNK